MASASSVLSEEHFQCSICLDVFTDPVSTPCGHNFCKACIKGYWDGVDQCQCPFCKETFMKRPELRVNTTFKDVVDQFKKMSVTHIDEAPPKPREVPCDICTEGNLMALKSCLECLASYCETHLEPHYRVASFKKHMLIDPVENLEDRVCQKHGRPLEMFCRSDQTFVCVMCSESDHKAHNNVPLATEWKKRKTQLGKMVADVRQMIQERLIKVKEVKHSMELSEKHASKYIEDSVQFYTALMRSIEGCQAELTEEIEKKQETVMTQADGFIKELEQEITELQRKSTDLEQLSQTDDHLQLLQLFLSLCTPAVTKDWSEISVQSDPSVGAMRRAVARLGKTVESEIKNLSETVDVTLDPDTAHPVLILSEDGKQVRCGDTKQDLPENPKMFDSSFSVLGKEGFSSGRFYYEVEVKDNTFWIFGVVRESIDRKEDNKPISEEGYWVLWPVDVDDLAIDVQLCLSQKPQKVGVFVDYEEGQVSFFDVEARAHIYSFTGCTFTEKLYPYFCPACDDDDDDDDVNSAPLMITPVNQTD